MRLSVFHMKKTGVSAVSMCCSFLGEDEDIVSKYSNNDWGHGPKKVAFQEGCELSKKIKHYSYHELMTELYEIGLFFHQTKLAVG